VLGYAFASAKAIDPVAREFDFSESKPPRFELPDLATMTCVRAEMFTLLT